MKEVEIKSVDRRYEELRIKDKNREKELLISVIEGGVRDALQVVINKKEEVILLDGFKRLRSCIQIGMGMLPVVSVGSDEASGIMAVIRMGSEKQMHILEEARFVDELKKAYGMSVRQIAEHVNRSVGWVSMRLGMIEAMSKKMTEAVFTGKLPVRAYMYSLRAFTRVNSTEMDEFVKLVSGKGLSVRELDVLAKGYFQGSDVVKEQIRQGQLQWTIEQLKAVQENSDPKDFLRQLQYLDGNMQRVIDKIDREGWPGGKKEWVWRNRLLAKIPVLQDRLGENNDQRRQTKSDPIAA